MKIKKIEDVSMDEVYFENCLYRKLTEANLPRVAFGHDEDGYAIVSASRECENLIKESNRYFTEEQAKAENRRRTNYLRKSLIELGYSFIPTLGGYHELGAENTSYEYSFVVYPNKKGETVDYSKMFDDIMSLGKWYNQDSILFKFPGEKAKYINCKTGEAEVEFNGITLNDVSKEYFTSLKRWKDGFKNGKPQRFSYEGLYAPVGGSIMECHRRHCSNELFFNPYNEQGN